eukprot:5094812-Pyramimonas_sp.AAC.6
MSSEPSREKLLEAWRAKKAAEKAGGAPAVDKENAGGGSIASRKSSMGAPAALGLRKSIAGGFAKPLAPVNRQQSATAAQQAKEIKAPPPKPRAPVPPPASVTQEAPVDERRSSTGEGPRLNELRARWVGSRVLPTF